MQILIFLENNFERIFDYLYTFLLNRNPECSSVIFLSIKAGTYHEITQRNNVVIFNILALKMESNHNSPWLKEI